MKTAVEQTALEQAARGLCAAHYSKRFGKPVDDCHVQMNVDANWHALFADQVSETVTAYLAALPSGPVTEDDGRLTAIDRLRLHLEDAETFVISSDDLEGVVEEYDALRAAISRQPGAGEPVGYQWRDTKGRWHWVRNKVELESYRDINATLRPLYASPAPAVAEPGIRALEWGTRTSGKRWARTELGTYDVWLENGSWKWGFHARGTTAMMHNPVESEEAGISAANEHNAERIRAWLVPATSPKAEESGK